MPQHMMIKSYLLNIRTNSLGRGNIRHFMSGLKVDGDGNLIRLKGRRWEY